MGLGNSLLGLTRGQVPERATEEGTEDSLLALTRKLGQAPEEEPTFTPTPAVDVGIPRAFATGVKEGVLAPLALVLDHPKGLDLDETGEKVAGFLGEMVGLGLSFIPFTRGAGVVMRGIGLTTKLPTRMAASLALIKAGERVPQAARVLALSRQVAMNRAVQMTTAGAVQFGAMAEEWEDVPKNLALGAAFGGVIEGIFLASAIRNRGAVAARKLIDDVDNTVSGPMAAMEKELAASEAKSAARSLDELAGMEAGRPNEEILASLTGEHVENILFVTGKNIQEVLPPIRQQFPEARILVRPVFGGQGREVLIQNPLDPARLLTNKQEAQWQATGFFENMAVIWEGETWAATGFVQKGRAVLKRPFGESQGVASLPMPMIDELTRPMNLTIFGPQREQKALIEDALTALNTQKEIGFAIPTVGGMIRRGRVDTRKFQVYNSFDEFIGQNQEDLLQFREVGDLNAAVVDWADAFEVPGLIFREDGITSGVRIFDQASVKFVHEVPPIGQITNSGRVVPDATGRPVLEYFVPSWRDNATGVLRDRGIKEKDIDRLLSLMEAEEKTRLNSLMSPEFQSVFQASRAQSITGCV